MSNLPNTTILEEAWNIIKHLSAGAGPCNAEIAHQCRQLVIRDNIERDTETKKESGREHRVFSSGRPGTKPAPLIRMLEEIEPRNHSAFFDESEHIKRQPGFAGAAPARCPLEYKHNFLAYQKFGGTLAFFELGITPLD